jgi:hypothetical protein
MSGRHSDPQRGLDATKKSPLFQGRFGRMFRAVPAATFGHTDEENHANLSELAKAMSNSFDAPKDGKDDEESGIPALYTYFGQFIDHDITFDPVSTLRKADDPDALTDFRTPTFDLDNVYGRGPDDQPYMYEADGKTFILGEKIGGGSPGAHDLQRNLLRAAEDKDHPARALIGDPRNDENSIVSQFQGLVQRFHNRTAQDHPHLTFAQLQRHVRFHYQYLVLYDFLPRIIHSRVIADLKTGNQYDPKKLKFFHWKDKPFMPVEFSVAAYRLGHSMIRPGYRLNDAVLLPIFPIVKHNLPEGLTGFRSMNPKWGIDWGRFINIDVRKYDGDKAVTEKRLQFAYRIDTSLVNPLHDLPPSVASKPASLPERNLLRGWRLGLPSGQAVARAMDLTLLADDEIMIGQGTVTPDPDLKPITAVSPVFKGNCPLWTYILAEAMRNQEEVTIPVTEQNIQIKTPRLGPVGGRVVLEVFLGLLAGDSDSLLGIHSHWQPEKPKDGSKYELKDFVKYALGL